MTQHTPGPWRYQRDKEETGFVSHSYVWGPKVTVHCAGGDLNYAEPDMRLIAASPDMLEALIATREAHTLMEQLRALDLRDAAIAKATGEMK